MVVVVSGLLAHPGDGFDRETQRGSYHATRASNADGDSVLRCSINPRTTDAREDTLEAVRSRGAPTRNKLYATCASSASDRRVIRASAVVAQRVEAESGRWLVRHQFALEDATSTAP